MIADGGNVIRVGYMARNLPYPVNVRLPPIGSQDKREPKIIGRELDVVFPVDDLRHTKLGQFMNSWSRLEQTLSQVLTKLLRIKLGDTITMISAMGTRQVNRSY
jgi:hypothetical protein